MFNSLIIASVGNYTKGKADKNGCEPVILKVVAGKCPNRTILAGTVAEMLDIVPGKTYLFSVNEKEEDPTYGRQFSFTKLKEVDALEIVKSAKEMDKAEVFQVEAATVGVAAKDFSRETV